MSPPCGDGYLNMQILQMHSSGVRIDTPAVRQRRLDKDVASVRALVYFFTFASTRGSPTPPLLKETVKKPVVLCCAAVWGGACSPGRS